ncbi:phospholipid/diacylglycerol acyltransferase [Dacryopinax primogenitus]|uniref:Phospholipid/diacylglycerol acyltransferase n=1 Tax=Dacryopinax primogenitus (strain DJM 731) TaxID=1858805 RepID=M5FP05_DACPD|nr:phospholipid/diacylglycerol acyltransferase [Dacryopinax primogenitus]EJT96683.1 phospholipid/diacylglycerol acyltransferase [Dacryopinax primogenitus]
MFAFGLGIIAAIFLVVPLPPQLSALEDFDLPNFSISDAMPNWSLELSLSQIVANVRETMAPTSEWLTSRDFKVGTELAEKGYAAEFPVIMVPGIVSTGLESWSTSEEARTFFRKRLWGTTTMIRAVLTDKERWVKSLKLDTTTGLDPPGIKVRAAQGIDAASTFIPGYWIWAKVIENLACLNYDSNNLFLAAYDWRLSFYNLEERDSYFSLLKMRIELYKQKQGKKTVIVGHSMGSEYFLKWVEASGPKYGNGGPKWVDEHIEAFVNIAGTMFGVAKAITAFLSGEMKDTVEINPAGSYVLERYFSRRERAQIFRSWAGSASMWIKGGNDIWGNGEHAPDDPDNCTLSHGRFFSFQQEHGDHVHQIANMTADEVSKWVLERTPVEFQRMLATNYSYGMERDEEKLKKNDHDHTKWVNPLEVRLPNAPDMKIYCLYGYGKETELMYTEGPYEPGEEHSDSSSIAPSAESVMSTNGSMLRGSLDLPTLKKNWIDTSVNYEAGFPKIKNGVKVGEGDGTVSLISLGSMCVEGWKHPRWNPAKIPVTVQEMLHEPETLDLRGGPKTADHIDILGSTALNEAILKVASGRGQELEDRFVSPIQKYVKRMKWD